MNNSSKRIAGYEIVAEISAGPMSAVYAACDVSSGRKVALTILPPELSADKEYLKSFRARTTAIARLNYPHIARLYAGGISKGACFLAAELVEGETLQQRIENEHVLPPTDALAVCVSIGYALEYAWRKTKLIHGGISPADIWLTHDGKVKLGGFGIPRNAGGAVSREVLKLAAPGLAHYMSPELAGGDVNADFRADIYSLGCALFHMLTGRPPFEAPDAVSLLHKHIHEPPPMFKAMPNCPVPLGMLVNKMLAKQPLQRHRSYEELNAELVHVHDLLHQELEKKATVPMQVHAGRKLVPRLKRPTPAPASAPVEGEKEWRLMLYVAGGLAALVVGVGVYWWLSRPPPEPAAAQQTPPQAAAKAGSSEPAADPLTREVSALAPEEQLRRVMADLKQRNPGFDGAETHKIEDGQITELGFSTTAVRDISVLRALTKLRKLQCGGEGGMGALTDLSSLSDLPLTQLKCHSNAVSDLTPLRGMALAHLGLRDTKVSDLAALQGMPLKHLDVRNTPVNDLAPLKGMKLEVLMAQSTAVADLAPLQDMPLRTLYLTGAKVQDLAPLKGMPLRELACDFKPERDMDVLRSIKTLERINYTPAAEFWMKTGAQLAAMAAPHVTGAVSSVSETFIKDVAVLSPAAQVERVVSKLKELNPQFGGQATHRIEDGKVTELALVTVGVTNISPLRALPSLQFLRLNGTTARGSLADLSSLTAAAFPSLKRLWCHFTEVSDLAPLAALPLEELYCDRTRVDSLAPLRGMPLKELRCDFRPARDKETLWAIKSLHTINDQPAAEFWKSAGPPEDPFFKQAAALPAERLLAAVMAKLKELNPRFDGRQTHKITDGAVTELAISTAGVTDISPLKALRQLEKLSLTPWNAAQRGSLASLAPLQGLPLTSLRCQNNPIADLAPLKGMPLTSLACGGSQVSDLAPLSEMRLTALWCEHTGVRDLGPLEGMPLAVLGCNGAPIADASPLQGLPLQELNYDPRPEHTAVVLRIKSLQRVNGLPAAMFKMRAEIATKSGGNAPAVQSQTPRAPALRPTAASRPASPAPATPAARDTGGVSPKEQVRRFVEKLKELNPSFDGQTEHKADGNKVVELSLSTEKVTDLTPIRTLTSLQKLVCRGPLDATGNPTAPGLLADLSPISSLRLLELDCRNNNLSTLTPLQGLPLTRLRCAFNPITDLAPLKGMPLTVLQCNSKFVKDLTPLRDMKLTELSVTGTQVQDLSPLKGMPLRSLGISTTPVTDLTLLGDMPLAYLTIGGTTISDLTPLKNLRLVELSIYRTKINDLSPLRGMPLAKLSCYDTEVTDLQLLQDMPLKELRCDFVAERDAKTLRAIKTLEKINDLPAAEFWKRVDAGESPRATSASASKSLPSAASAPSTGANQVTSQIQRFVAKMKQLNPDFDGQVQHTIEQGKVTRLEFSTEAAADISPVRVFTELKVLRCAGVYRDKTSYKHLADLSPLAGLSLKELQCQHSLVSDLGPLKGQPIEILTCGSTSVTDLSVLKGMPLKQLSIIHSRIADISPLRGLPLQRFSCEGSQVSDLSPLKGAPLQSLSCHKTKVTDLSVLRGLPLRELKCDFVPDRDAEILRSIKTLTLINDRSAAEFWQSVKAGDAPQPK